MIELNLADSALLETLPGIGPAFAGRIIRYRRILGGFRSPGQLREVYGMTEERYRQFEGKVTVDSGQDLNLTSKGAMSFDSKQKALIKAMTSELALEASGSTLKGTMVDIAGNTKTSLKGNAMVEIQGGMVKIN